MNLSNKEWSILKEIARSILSNATPSEFGNYWTIWDTMTPEEIAVLKKLVPDVNGLRERLSGMTTITQSQYENALSEYGICVGTNELLEINCWMLNRGPKLVEG